MPQRFACADNASMSNFPAMRRGEKQMGEAACWDFLAQAFSGRLATADAQGRPYITPLLHLAEEGVIWVHTAGAHGHLRANIDVNPAVCFEADAPGPAFAYGRFECDSGLAYASVVAFGRIEIVDDEAGKQAFFERLMRKYLPPDGSRPENFFPRLGGVTVYRIGVERVTGKQTVLPRASSCGPTWIAR
jgi:nitroimidazol reductase NimA-like FMN-containing flavoprotein (pyridoxamine 5'-phosphate oxidase superfamily)